MGQIEAARAEYTQAAHDNPHDSGAHANLGNLLKRDGRNEEAIVEYAQSLKIHDNPEVRDSLGNTLLALNRAPEAIDQFRAEIGLNPALAQAHNNLGSALLSAGKIPESIDELEITLQLNPSLAEAHFNLGNALLASGHAADAIPHFEEALKLKPDYAEAHHHLGFALAACGNLPDAIVQDQTALQLEPKNVATLNDLGNALARSGRLPEAIKAYEQALQLEPGNNQRTPQPRLCPGQRGTGRGRHRPIPGGAPARARRGTHPESPRRGAGLVAAGKEISIRSSVILSLSKDQFSLFIPRATELILRQAQDDGRFFNPYSSTPPLTPLIASSITARIASASDPCLFSEGARRRIISIWM